MRILAAKSAYPSLALSAAVGVEELSGLKPAKQ